MAASYRTVSTSASGAVAEAAASRKTAKYASIANTHIFVPIAVETMGPVGAEAESFLSELGRRLSQHVGVDDTGVLGSFATGRRPCYPP